MSVINLVTNRIHNLNFSFHSTFKLILAFSWVFIITVGMDFWDICMSNMKGIETSPWIHHYSHYLDRRPKVCAICTSARKHNHQSIGKFSWYWKVKNHEEAETFLSISNSILTCKSLGEWTARNAYRSQWLALFHYCWWPNREW